MDKLLANKKYVPIVGMEVYLDAQFEKDYRCNVDYDKAGHPRKAARYRSPALKTGRDYTNPAFPVILMKKEGQAMTEEEISELYIRLAFQYASAIGQLLDKKIIDQDLVDRHRKSFYDSLDEEKLKIWDYTEIIRRYMRDMICEDMVSLTELARRHSEESPGYAIQS